MNFQKPRLIGKFSSFVEFEVAATNNGRTNEADLTLVSRNDFEQIEAHLGECLDRLLNVIATCPPPLNSFSKQIRGYVLEGGKRLRPQLCVWSFLNTADASVDRNVLDLACAWEIFHSFLLVHDDLIDVADMRRRIPSLHRQLESLDHNSPKFGQHLAIVSGDLLFSSAIRLLAEMEIDPSVQVQLIRLFSRIACTTGFGQAIDIFQSQVPLAGISEEALLREYDWKTAAYTFEGPLLSGAILAGAAPSVQAVISRFSASIGRAYQMQNDLMDLSQPAHEGCDLVQGKRTVSLMRARAGMTSADRCAFDHRLKEIAQGNGHAVRLAESLRQDLCESGAIEQTQSVIGQLLDSARTSAADSHIPRRFSNALVSLINSLERSYFTAAPLPVESAAMFPELNG